MNKLISLLSMFTICLIPSFAMAQSSAAEGQPGYLAPPSACPTGFTCFKPYGSINPGVAGSASSSVVLLTKPGNLLGVYVTSGGTQGWLMVFNSTSAPADGATTAGTAAGNMQECIYVPEDTTQSISFQGGPTEFYSTGITAVFSSTGCATKTANASAFIHGIAQ